MRVRVCVVVSVCVVVTVSVSIRVSVWTRFGIASTIIVGVRVNCYGLRARIAVAVFLTVVSEPRSFY